MPPHRLTGGASQRSIPASRTATCRAATIFWDYFQFDDALAELAAARKQFHNAALYGYEAGAIAENKNSPAQAVAEYVTASVAEAPNLETRAWLLVLANRPAYAQLIDEATARAVAVDPTLATLSLRVDVLTARHQQAGIAALVDAATAHAEAPIKRHNSLPSRRQHQLTASSRHALEREIVLSADPVQRIQLQYTLAQSFTEGKDLAAAQTIIRIGSWRQSKLLGVVRATHRLLLVEQETPAGPSQH